MIVINKKRIQIILSCIAIAIFAFAFPIISKEKEEKAETSKQNTVATTATPVSGKTIIIDAGHGVPDEGAQSSNRDNRSTN